MARDDLQVNFRMPAELKARLEAAAAASGRTLTAEVVYRLNASFQTGGPIYTGEAPLSPDQLQQLTTFLLDAVTGTKAATPTPTKTTATRKKAP
jgi:hypothetical protein